MINDNIKWIVVILISTITLFSFYFSKGLFRSYQSNAKKIVNENIEVENEEVLRKSDIKHLPEIVQKYISYTGFLNKPKVKSFYASFGGEMKLDENKDWVKVNNIEQYNSYTNYRRYFYMKLNMGVPVIGVHTYDDEEASMVVKVLGLLKVVDQRGNEMRISDTVTLLNDMCLIAPGALIDPRITWEEVDDFTVKAILNYSGIEVSALLMFNEKGQLKNFITEDRYFYRGEKEKPIKVRWETPIDNYKNINGYNLLNSGVAKWVLEDREYAYIKFNDIKEIKYNPKELK